jgi:fructose-1,6-bisphosphatase/inositol monophosphatase family enzyme
MIITDGLQAGVVALMREVATTIMMPRFRDLKAGEIAEKAPDDYVTVVDTLSEARLIAGLTALLPGSHVVGEEGVAADPALIGRVAEGAAWIVDPLDGTGNFAAGRTPFAIMVALCEGGVTQAGWILDPVGGRLCHAVLGRGAFIDGERVTARSSGAALPIAALAMRYLPDDVRADIGSRADGRFTLADIPNCAGEQYPRILLGSNDIALFWRALPWDHAPGALILNEAGGRMARADGSQYLPGEPQRVGLLAAATPALWDMAAAILFGRS